MACGITITAVNGIVQPGQMNPTSVRVLGNANQCPSGQVQVTVTGVAAPQIATVDGNGRFRAELLLQTGSTVQCGQTVTVRVECVGLPACYVNVPRVLECCEFPQLFFQAVSAVGVLTPNAIQVSGTLLGCASDTVMIGSSVTATVGPIAVDPMTGAFSVQVPTTTAVQCDDEISVTASCGGSSGCRKGVKGKLSCTTCYRASVTVDTSAPCTGTPAVKRVTLTASIAIAAGSTQNFYWYFGDGTVGSTFTINNSAGTATTVNVHTETHDYAPGTYTATLKINREQCEELRVTVVVQCATTGCPTVTVDPPQIAQNCVNGKRTVTLTSHITASAGPSVFAQWDFGNSSMGSGIVVNSGATVTTPQTHDYVPGNYTAQLSVLSPSGCSSQPVTLNVPPCSPPMCTLAVQNVAVQIGPCDPATGTRTVTATGTVNNADPADIFYWQWDSNPAQVGLPASQGTTQQHQYPAPSTGQTSYNVTLTVIRSATCVSSSTKPITIDGCGAPCPQVNDITVTPQACASTSSTTRPVDLTAQVSNAAGTTYDWDFGDGSPVVASPTATAPRHDYAAPGTYTAKVTAKTPGCSDATASKSFSVATCDGGDPTPPTPPPTLPSCAILLWIAILLLVLGSIVVTIGVCISVPWVWIVGAIIGALGLILFIIWLIVCSIATLCSVMRDVHCFLFVMVAIVAPIFAILAGVFGGQPCAIAAAVSGLSWGTMYAWLGFIMRRRSCPPTC